MSALEETFMRRPRTRNIFHHGLKVDCLRFRQVPFDVIHIACSAGESATRLDVCRSNSPCINVELSGPLAWRSGTKRWMRDEYVRCQWQ